MGAHTRGYLLNVRSFACARDVLAGQITDSTLRGK